MFIFQALDPFDALLKDIPETIDSSTQEASAAVVNINDEDANNTSTTEVSREETDDEPHAGKHILYIKLY